MNIKYIPLLLLGLSLSGCDPNSHIRDYACKVKEVEQITGRKRKSPIGKVYHYTFSSKDGERYEFDWLTGALIPAEPFEKDSETRYEAKTYLQGDWWRYNKKLFYKPKGKDEYLLVEYDTAINIKTKEFKEGRTEFDPTIADIAIGKCEVTPPKNPYIQSEEEKQQFREATS